MNPDERTIKNLRKPLLVLARLSMSIGYRYDKACAWKNIQVSYKLEMIDKSLTSIRISNGIVGRSFRQPRRARTAFEPVFTPTVPFPLGMIEY